MKEESKEIYRPSLLLGIVLGALTSLAVTGLSYLGQQGVGLPFLAFDMFDWLARVVPGSVAAAGVDTMVRIITFLGVGPIGGIAKTMEQVQGILMLVVGGALLGLIITLVVRYSDWPGSYVGLAGGLVAFGLVAAMEINLRTSISSSPVVDLVWLAALLIVWATLLGNWLDGRRFAEAAGEMTHEIDIARRRFLVKLAGGSVGLALGAWGIGHLLAERPGLTLAGQLLSRLTTVTPQPSFRAIPKGSATPVPAATATAIMEGRIQPAPGTRPEITPNKDFYRVDIDTTPPVINQTSWVLEVRGLFDHPRPLKLSDLLAYPAVTQPITLSCISNPIGGDLISTSNWIGVRLGVVLQDLGLRSEAKELYIKAADGFYESVAMADMMDPRTLLVYGMDGDALPAAHGFPLRIYIPNRYGMKQPKWMTSMEAIGHEASGYWEERGWSAQAVPHIVSIIDTVAKDYVQNGRIPVGGIAWAGNRGIQKVELRVDNGEWLEAELRTPPLSPLTWVQWRYNWPSVSGQHTFTVRATDGTGKLQIGKSQPPYPNGATGYDSVTVTI